MTTRMCEWCNYSFEVHRYNEIYCPGCRHDAYRQLVKDHYDRNRATILPAKRQYYWDHRTERLAYANARYRLNKEKR